MSTLLSTLSEKVLAGDTLTDDEANELVATNDLVSLGMIADEIRRARHGDGVTFVRVEAVSADESVRDRSLPPSTGELRLVGAPTTLDAAVALVRDAAALAGGRVPVSAFNLSALERLAGSEPLEIPLKRLRDTGLELVAEVDLDRVTEPSRALNALLEAGLHAFRLTLGAADARDVVKWCRLADRLQAEFGEFRAFAPLSIDTSTEQPSTGYDDVRVVAVARMLVREIGSIQVDWSRYGPKLAQVAMLFGANDLDAVSTSDESEHGPRRAPLEEVRRNIRAASRSPIERDGRFEVRA